jgi:hypothetical protein
MDIRVNGQRYRYWRDIPLNVQQALIESGVFMDGAGESTPPQLMPRSGSRSSGSTPYQLRINGQRYGPEKPVPGLLASVLYTVGERVDPQAAQRRRVPRMGRSRSDPGATSPPPEIRSPTMWDRAENKPIVNWVGPRISSGRKQPPPLGSSRRSGRGTSDGDTQPSTHRTSRQAGPRPAPRTPPARIKPPPMQPPPAQQSPQPTSGIGRPSGRGDQAGTRQPPPPSLTHQDSSGPLSKSSGRPQAPPRPTPGFGQARPGDPVSRPPASPVAYGSWEGSSRYPGPRDHGVISEVGQRSTLFLVLGIVAVVILVILLLALTAV